MEAADEVLNRKAGAKHLKAQRHEGTFAVSLG